MFRVQSIIPAPIAYLPSLADIPLLLLLKRRYLLFHYPQSLLGITSTACRSGSALTALTLSLTLTLTLTVLAGAPLIRHGGLSSVRMGTKLFLIGDRKGVTVIHGGRRRKVLSTKRYGVVG